MTSSSQRDLRALLFAATAAGAIAAYGAARADTAEGAAPLATGGAVTAADTSAAQVAEVIVTSQRREEDIEKVPLTVTALTGKTLSQLNVLTFEDVLKYTPNVTFGNNGPGQGEIF